ncbi:MAG: alpha/beta hydrolase [Pseudonocardiaceae bacterium]
MVTVADIRNWHPERLDEAFDQLRRQQDMLVTLEDELGATRSPQDWEGDAAAAAQLGYDWLAEDLRRLVAGIAAVQRSVGQASDVALAVTQALTEAQELARFHGFEVTAAGAVLDIHPPNPAVPDYPAIQAERAIVRDEVTDRVRQVLCRATELAADLATVMGEAAARRIDDGPATTTLAGAALAGHFEGGLAAPTPPPGGSATDNAGWWASLSPAERFTLVAAHPQLIGNLDGIPAQARDSANRIRLPEERAALAAEVTRLEALQRSYLPPYHLAQDFALAQDLSTARDKLAAIDAIQTTLDKPGQRQLLVLDTSGERAKAAIASGDIDTAQHVAVFTPGMTSTVQDSMIGYDDQLDLLRREAQNQTNQYGDAGQVAVVTWLGYEAPQWDETLDPSDSVAGQAAAYRGAEKLAGFLDGIDASHTDDLHLTALGHSYGSTTTGLALQETEVVEDVVFFGSPGIGTSDVTNLNVPAGKAYVIEASWDPVADTGRFGTDPNQLDGITNLSAREHTLDGRQLTEVTGHTNYLTQGSTSQYNMGMIVAGVRQRVIQDDNDGAGDWLRNPENWDVWGA